MACLINRENIENSENSENSEILNDRRNVAAYKFMLDMLNKGQKSGIYELTESKNLVESLIILKCVLEQSPDLPTEFEKNIIENFNVMQNELINYNKHMTNIMNYLKEINNKIDNNNISVNNKFDSIENCINNLTIED